MGYPSKATPRSSFAPPKTGLANEMQILKKKMLKTVQMHQSG